jgi:serine protease Do
MKTRRAVYLLLFIAFAVSLFIGGAVIDRLQNISFLDRFLPTSSGILEQKLVREESAVIDIAEKSSPSVVTISIEIPQRRVLEFSPFGGGVRQRTEEGGPNDIGTGFIVSSDGLIVTNKHVVSGEGTYKQSLNGDTSYKVITRDDKEYDVVSINRDPTNDIAILKIDASNLTPLELGSSDNLKVGQFVVAIGTALGEFRHTVTTGVISGLGRGITAGSAYEGFVEKLDDVIQTDAAINPGNSGGPLLNSAGQVIGVNVAVAQGAQNVGFAIPVDIVKSGLEQFKANGKFEGRAYLGVRYEMIPSSTAILNDVPQGAYVVEVLQDSPAESAGIKVEDIIKKIDGKDLKDQNDLSEIIKNKKVGDKIDLEIYRDGETLNVSTTLSEFTE